MGNSAWFTVTAALRISGLAATTLFGGATNGERFWVYVTNTLILVLRRGDTVILDNLPSHKVAGVRDAFEAVSARLFYSPDFHPIEHAFAKLRARNYPPLARVGFR